MVSEIVGERSIFSTGLAKLLVREAGASTKFFSLSARAHDAGAEGYARRLGLRRQCHLSQTWRSGRVPGDLRGPYAPPGMKFLPTWADLVDRCARASRNRSIVIGRRNGSRWHARLVVRGPRPRSDLNPGVVVCRAGTPFRHSPAGRVADFLSPMPAADPATTPTSACNHSGVLTCLVS